MDYFDILLAKKLEDDRDPKVEGLSVTKNGRYHEDGVVYDPVIVNVPETPLSKLTVTENGTYTAPSGTAYNEVDVDVPLPENAYLLKDIPNTPTAIATFTDGADLPMPKLEVGIEPVQEGSGDPSPENIRPISGWDEVNVTRCGKNRITSITEGIELNSSDGTTKSNVSWYVADYSRVEYGKTYYVSGTSSATVCYYDRYKNFTRNTLSQRTITPQEGECYVRVNSLISGYAEPQIEEGNEATSFSPFGQTYTIDLNGTRYGGNVDLISGVMTVDKVGVDLGTLNWLYSTSYSGFFYSNDLASDIKNGSICLSPIYTNISGGSSTIENNNNNAFFNVNSSGSAYTGGAPLKSLIITNRSYSDATAFKTAMNGVQLVYELSTPLTIQLPTTVVKSLSGVNNVWADCGDILDLSYLAKEE
jgi:hypothetical protein